MSIQSQTADAAQLDDRDVRALSDGMTVLDDLAPAPADADGLFHVTTESGRSYVVDPDLGACQCADAKYRDVRCKHSRRVDFETGRRPLPAWIDPAALDDQFRQFVSPETQTRTRTQEDTSQ